MAKYSNRLYLIFTLFVFALIFTWSIAGCGGEEETDKEKEPDKEVEKEEPKEDKDVNLDAIECHFCGAEEDHEYDVLSRPILVTYGNSSDERPHSGISEACVVYELRVEGSHTRLLALFNKDVPGDIGNVRSARLDFITLALENDSYYVHVGGHQAALNEINRIGLSSLNEFRHAGFWRSDDRGAPYNVYTEISQLVDSADSRGYSEDGEREGLLDFRDEESMSNSSEEVSEVQINYGSNFNVINYEYQEDEGVYLRKVDNEPHLDREHDQEVKASNIIIQYANSRTIDDEGRRDIDLVGNGEGMYISKGEMIPITWEKECEEAKTKFYDENGDEINLYPGQTWINVVEEDKVTVE
ncbi:DUF3048 domain-containing protein [Natranaerofaba carboxydovora]|uniref:DUF3048 domain-containing protein n=1 Tax=Natranaerofaba carboxydovora TaxID=2742683 RepID=UPI001F132D97|nr:DUF3048 domain-containing protein [Natranaerofaba carboxydovora]UMZ75067.1 Putative lipoprotein YerB [Natranaerofaba carboxydovora]